MKIEPKDLCERAGYRSIDELAVKVRELWEADEPEAKKLEPRSLAAKIGALARPIGAQWWKKRPRATAALCEALDVAADELGVGGLPEPDGRWVFRECSRLRPLDLSQERPCEIASWRHIDWHPGLEMSRGLGATRSQALLTPMFHPVKHAPAQFWGCVPSGWGRMLSLSVRASAPRRRAVSPSCGGAGATVKSGFLASRLPGIWISSVTKSWRCTVALPTCQVPGAKR